MGYFGVNAALLGPRTRKWGYARMAIFKPAIRICGRSRLTSRMRVLRGNTLDSDIYNLYYLFMKTQTQYITDGKGKKKAVILDIKEYERLIHALEELEDKKAFVSVVHKKSIPYGEIESRLKKSKRV